MTIIYLASPYTHPLHEVRSDRVRAASQCAAALMELGHVVFSPITHGHQVADHLPEDLAHDHEFWMGQCLPMLGACQKLYILPLRGWRESRGLGEEIAWARREGRQTAIIQSDAFPQLEHLRAEDIWESSFLPYRTGLIHLPI